MQKSFWSWQYSNRYTVSLFPHLHTPFSPSLVSLVVFVDVKRRIYLWLGAADAKIKVLPGEMPELFGFF